jgi:autotransporter-associated beta strand protein
VLAGGNNISVRKTGSSTWTLSGANTYTGTTAVEAGTLNITGSNALATGAVTVAANATFGGNGSIGGSVTINDGAHHALTVAATPETQVTRTITGTLTHIPGDILNLSAAAQPADGDYILATANGGIVSTPTQVTYSGIAGGSISVVGANLLLTVDNNTGPSYDEWASSFGLDPEGDGAEAADKDNDGFNNLTEYLLGGSPVSGTNNPKIFSLVADGEDPDSSDELILTIAVPEDMPAFSAGAPATAAPFQGHSMGVRGSSELGTFASTVTPLAAAVSTNLPPAPDQGGVTYEYRSFSLGGSNGLTGRGFLQVVVDAP